MKAIVLCAGLGKRLRPLTWSTSKHLIPVANKPILFYSLEMIQKVGIDEVGLIVGESNTDIEDAVRDGNQWGLKVTYILQKDPKGVAHAAKVAQDFVGDESFVMYLGDNLLIEGLNGFVSAFKQNKPNAMVLLYGVDNPSQFGVAELKDGRISRVVEKPKNPATNLAIVGAYMFDKNIFTAIDNIKPSWRNELEITDAIQYLIENDYVVQPYIAREWWKDTGRPEEILEANRFMLDYIEEGIKRPGGRNQIELPLWRTNEKTFPKNKFLQSNSIKGKIDKKSSITGKVLIEEGTEIINSVIKGPVIVGKNCKIADSFIGSYTSIGDNSLIENSKIEYSVLMEKCSILNINEQIKDSLFGRNVVLRKSETGAGKYRFIQGDNCFTELP